MRRLFLFLLLSSLLSAQEMNRDSLLRLLPKAKEDTSKVLLYINLGNSVEYEDTENAGKYYRLAGKLSKKLNYKKGILKYISNYTAILNIKGELDSAFTLNKQGVEIAKDLGDKLILAKATANLGNSYNYRNDMESTLAEYQKALTLFEEIKEDYFKARMQDLLQNVYCKLNMSEKGISYGKAATDYFRKQGKKQELASALINLSNNYSNAKQEEQSLKAYQEALEISQEIGFRQGELTTLLGLGNTYFHRFEIEKSKSCYEKALTISIDVENKEGETISNRGLAMCYIQEKEFDKAELFIDKALKLAKNLDLKKEIMSSMNLKSSILFAKHDVETAEKYLDSAGIIEQKLFGDEIRNKIINLDKKYETEKKENQIRLQNAQIRQKNILNYILIGSAVALLLILFLSYRNYSHKKKLQVQKITELETEKQLAATEAVLRGEEQERSRLAKDLHDGLGGMLSGVKHSFSAMKENLIMTSENAEAFERSIHQLDNSIREMRRVAHNMLPENLLKYGLDNALREFCTELGRTTSLETSYQSIDMEHQQFSQDISVTGYRVVQELANNALKHSGAKHLLVQAHFSDEEKMLHITVEDDGKGFDKAMLSSSEGIGWKNIRNRVQFVKGKIDLNSGIGKGTSVLIEIPV
ncbi:signal transduction histidine kinase [Epilithonimonas hungarica]|uniref:tetratricopeptide repeat-containing sensor histidine kinase n=1 Tax=Epilithonimonas hungarica TaxID=454006 RepID=UPI002789D95E|nr:tetratricopeptide repeat protein [Epilithonimonas hungarica]MDP9954476.1 signal transduction histidine kinase [Epilithonimonas hungarica]